MIAHKNSSKELYWQRVGMGIQIWMIRGYAGSGEDEELVTAKSGETLIPLNKDISNVSVRIIGH
jgi:hypothetical protein